MFYNITYILYIHKENLWTLSFLLCSICLGFPALDPDVERLVGMSLPMKGGGKGPFDAQVARERIAILTSHNLFTLCFRTSFTRMTLPVVSCFSFWDLCTQVGTLYFLSCPGRGPSFVKPNFHLLVMEWGFQVIMFWNKIKRTATVKSFTTSIYY